MARVSEKALRPRQYVFNRLSADRIAQLAPGVQKLMEQERQAAASERAAQVAREATEAARHAQNIMSGVQAADPESDTIRALEKELEELQEKKRSLFAELKRRRDASEANKEAMPVDTPAAALVRGDKPLDERNPSEKPGENQVRKLQNGKPAGK